MDFIKIQYQFYGLRNLYTILWSIGSRWKLMHSLERMFRDQLYVSAQLQWHLNTPEACRTKSCFHSPLWKRQTVPNYSVMKKSDSFTQALKPLLFTRYNHGDFKATQTSRNLHFVPELKDKRWRSLCKPHPPHSSFRSMNIWAKAEICLHSQISFVKWHLLASLAQRNLIGRRHWQILFSQCLTNDTEGIPIAYMESETK